MDLGPWLVVAVAVGLLALWVTLTEKEGNILPVLLVVISIGIMYTGIYAEGIRLSTFRFIAITTFEAVMLVTTCLITLIVFAVLFFRIVREHL
jgi:hypothetical protein